jgi:hypothetical protein
MDIDAVCEGHATEQLTSVRNARRGAQAMGLKDRSRGELNELNGLNEIDLHPEATQMQVVHPL